MKISWAWSLQFNGCDESGIRMAILILPDSRNERGELGITVTENTVQNLDTA